jgi:hypothetical protein
VRHNNIRCRMSVSARKQIWALNVGTSRFDLSYRHRRSHIRCYGIFSVLYSKPPSPSSDYYHLIQLLPRGKQDDNACCLTLECSFCAMERHCKLRFQ